MIDHIGIYVPNLLKSHQFYHPLLSAIGLETIFSNENFFAYGRNGNPEFEIYTENTPTTGMHIAFQVNSMDKVHTFYHEALKLEAKDNGAPGFRNYLPGYYACYIHDLNGHNLEAVFIDKEASK
jgi:catechol 2,3-dioxygenase-like lactoylglutathione lyase family enzyme